MHYIVQDQWLPLKEKNKVKIVFTTEAQRPSALEIHNWIDETLHIIADQIDMMQLKGHWKGSKLLLSDVERGGTSNVREPTRVTEGEEVTVDESKQQNVDMITEATVEEETDTSSETDMAKSVVPTIDHLTLGELDQPQDTEIEQEPTTRQATTDECMETTSVPTIVKPLHSPGELPSNTDGNEQEE
ncbi:hypothetical protein ANN_28071 [Periplaneta americana]|uniref:Uncharacterized protein n=1 Tax=Periplaneta americana TaxID=6978 RepID=A0ABQ8RUU9_PERAM|nr:hypothetical protein ANN_28071 [Periplaneta americana]